mmetsp:Transcript_61276/g.68602  ORF Transcript_61276/g.68602 Transcript_61276/m.68602 type:complete len:220 (+) Transcript_61276:206-865(+)
MGEANPMLDARVAGVNSSCDGPVIEVGGGDPNDKFVSGTVRAAAPPNGLDTGVGTCGGPPPCVTSYSCVIGGCDGGKAAATEAIPHGSSCCCCCCCCCCSGGKGALVEVVFDAIDVAVVVVDGGRAANAGCCPNMSEAYNEVDGGNAKAGSAGPLGAADVGGVIKSKRRVSVSDAGGADPPTLLVTEARFGEGSSFNEFSIACRKYASSSSVLCGASSP